MFETITPIDNSVLLKREYATEEDIETSLSNSYSVREHWKNISLEDRKKSVLNFVEIFLKNKFVANIENLKKKYDSELKISTIDNQLFHKINNFSPFGIGNPKPKFIINDVVIRYPRVVGEKHLSFYFEDFYSTRIKAISFGSLGTKLGDVIKSSAPIKSALVSVTLNSWDGQENVELNVEDLIV